jgi:hypothetical protein
MYIVLKKTDEVDEILNILFGENEEEVQTWINTYMSEQIEDLKMCPLEDGIKNLDYVTNANYDRNQFELIKKYKKVHKGYVYNSSEKLTKVLCTIKYIQYDGNCNVSFVHKKSVLKRDLNNEINSRVMRQLDKDSLYQVMTNIQQKTLIKKSWDSFEFTNMVSETIRSFKKELYSSIAKKMKRFGQYKKEVIPKIVVTTGACALEAKKKME